MFYILDIFVFDAPKPSQTLIAAPGFLFLRRAFLNIFSLGRKNGPADKHGAEISSGVKLLLLKQHQSQFFGEIGFRRGHVYLKARARYRNLRLEGKGKVAIRIGARRLIINLLI